MRVNIDVERTLRLSMPGMRQGDGREGERTREGGAKAGVHTLSSTAIRTVARARVPAASCDGGAAAPPSWSADAALAEQISAEVTFIASFGKVERRRRSN